MTAESNPDVIKMEDMLKNTTNNKNETTDISEVKTVEIKKK